MSGYPDEGLERMPIAHTVEVIGEIAAERGRQVSMGYDAAHDDAHEGPVLTRAGMTHGYLAQMGVPLTSDYALDRRDRVWPWPAVDCPPPEFQSERAHLVKACALFVAAIERLDRAAARRGAGR